MVVLDKQVFWVSDDGDFWPDCYVPDTRGARRRHGHGLVEIADRTGGFHLDRKFVPNLKLTIARFNQFAEPASISISIEAKRQLRKRTSASGVPATTSRI
jgi:hypothetical protein